MQLIAGPVKRLGMIGFGAMGREVMAGLAKLAETDAMKAVLVRSGREAPQPFTMWKR